VNVLDEWTREVASALGLDAAQLDRDLVLELTTDGAPRDARPAAPLTAYLVGLAAGLAGGSAEASADAAAAVRRLALARPEPQD
jgi:hypothetical protein